MPDKFDPYREQLIVEHITDWPAEYAELPAEQKNEIAAALHADPESCAQLEYVRQHTGFCRKITVTDEDVQRVTE
ncbi:MAG: hypothetical protein NXI22_22020 [bacterium]|nr:hypothetical protein [bacterium]